MGLNAPNTQHQSGKANEGNSGPQQRTNRFPAVDERRCMHFMGWDDFCLLVDGHSGAHGLAPGREEKAKA